MNASRFYLPTLGDRTEIEAGLAGLRPELYRRMLGEISAQLGLAAISAPIRFSATACRCGRSSGCGTRSCAGCVTRHPADSLDNLTHQTRRGCIA